MPIVIVDPVEAVRLYLLTDGDLASLVAGRIAYEELPRADAPLMPRKAVVLTSTGGRMPLHLRAGWQRIDVRCYGETIYEARVVNNVVRDLLRGIVRMTRASTLVYAATAEGAGLSLRDPDTDWPFMLTAYSVFAGETPAS